MVARSDKLERYELIERIAVGGMAEVFRAKRYGSHGFQKIVAIKRILPTLAADPEFEHRFIAEAKIAVTLSHANIVQVLDFSRFGESLYIVMEFIDGMDLAGLLRIHRERDALIPLDAAFQIAIEMLQGLHFAHTRGIVHRDISPSNVLVSQAGAVKLADFGIAQATGRASGRLGVMGKWRYMSPEQARGEELDPRSDLFSAAIVMFELFTGTRLFSGDTPDEVTRNIHEMTLPRSSALRPDLPSCLDDVLLAALARDQAQRTDNAATILNRLIDICYSSALKATAMVVASLVEDCTAPTRTADDNASASARIIDDIINSELDSDENTPGRVTAIGGAPPLFVPDSDYRDGPLERSPTTGHTLVKKQQDDDAITEWVLESSTQDAETVAELAGNGDVEAESKNANADAQARGAPRSRRYYRWAVLALLAIVTIWLLTTRADHSSTSSSTDSAQEPTQPIRTTPVQSSVPKAGLVHVSSEPSGAAISVNGELWPERTPSVVSVAESTQAGLYRFRVTHAGYLPCDRESMHISSERPLTIDCKLERLTFEVKVTTTPPGATVTLDDAVLGTTPLSAIELSADGTVHVLQLELPGYERLDIPVSAVDPDPVDVQRSLVAVVRYGTIDVYSEPWADIFWNGKKIGTAPQRNIRLPYGRHRLELVNPVQGRKRSFTVSVPSKRSYRLTLTDGDQ